MEEDELAEVKRRIQEAEAALKRAEDLGNLELILKREYRLNLLLEKKKRLTTGTRIETTRAVATPPPQPQVVLPPQPPTVLYYELFLHNVNASLASLSEAKGFCNFVKANADKIGVTGFIQQFHHNDLKLGFEGTKGQCNDFLKWLIQLKSDYHMIERIESRIHGERRNLRLSLSFDKIMDHSRLKERGGIVNKGPYSDGEMDKMSEFSADRHGCFGTRSTV